MPAILMFPMGVIVQRVRVLFLMNIETSFTTHSVSPSKPTSAAASARLRLLEDNGDPALDLLLHLELILLLSIFVLVVDCTRYWLSGFRNLALTKPGADRSSVL